ncbi:MAG: immunoglobulin domain-containing protein [Verrucomicrobia bacterium]|nr:immunoglobulin domain-containing protein [Verrucomicrobiota bacterium]
MLSLLLCSLLVPLVCAQQAPTVTVQPQSQRVCLGGPVTLSVTATGSPPLSYTWLKGLATIPGATSSRLEFASVQTSDAGAYRVRVQNGSGAVTSVTATLEVLTEPKITLQPKSQTANEEADVTFTVSVIICREPAQYQWKKNLVPIAGATGSSLLLQNVQSSDAGSFQVVVTDAAGKSATSSAAVLKINAVNDAPSFDLATETVTVAEDAGLQRLANFATHISSGPADESKQTVSFTVFTSNPAFYAVKPTISTSGLLTFQTSANVNGTDTLSVFLTDNGGTAFGGVNQSSPKTFDLVVTAANDPPEISGLAAVTIHEDSGPLNLVFTVSDADTAPNLITVTASSSNPSLIANPVPVTGTGANRVLTLTPLAHANGKATIRVVAQDDQSAQTSFEFVLTVLPVNDAPSFTLSSTTVTLAEDAPLQTVANFATQISKGPADEAGQKLTFVVTPTDETLFATQPAISEAGVLSFKPALNANGTVSVSVYLLDNGGTSLGGINRSALRNFDIVFPPGNDAPGISGLTAKTINEDSSPLNVVFMVSDVDAAANLITVTATSSNPSLIANPVPVTGTGANRVLTLTPLANANGKATIKV